MKTYPQKICTRRSVAALTIIAKKTRQKRGSSAGDWLNGEVSTMEYPGGMKTDEREYQVPNQVNVNTING